MERTQKQITGRAPAPYAWDDRRYERMRNVARDKNAFRVEDIANARKREAKRKRDERMRLLFLELATVAVLVLMLSLVIGKLNSITRIKLDHKTLVNINETLRAEISAQESYLNNLSNDNSITYRAKMELGMIDPDEYSVHVLSNVKVNTSDAYHTAGAGNRK